MSKDTDLTISFTRKKSDAAQKYSYFTGEAKED